MKTTEDANGGSMQRVVRARYLRTESGGAWAKLELKITANIYVGGGVVTCMKGVPHPWWNVTRTDRYSPDGVLGEATTISIWRIRLGWWRASRPNDPSSATRRAGRNDCNRDALAGFAAAHG